MERKTKVVKSETSLCDQTCSLSLASIQLTRDTDVQFYTGLSNTNVYKTLFDHLSPKAYAMHYWKGPRQTLKEAPMRYSMDDDPNLFFKPGPGRKLKLELELLLVMMRLRLGLLVHDLACRFQISDSLISSIFITWIKLTRLELSILLYGLQNMSLKKTFHCASKSFIHMFVALLIAQRFLLKPRQALTLRLSVGQTITSLHSEIPSCNNSEWNVFVCIAMLRRESN